LYDRIQKVSLTDYYGLLGLTEDASEEEVQGSYRKVSVLCHPDKAPTELRDEAEVRFKAMQAAYRALSKKQTRIQYDSSIEFDDSIPSADEKITDKNFYSIYGPVFKRNERFSEVKPCPPFGDSNSDKASVNAFYVFWSNFKSWRDFAFMDDTKASEGSSRDQKRDTEQKNMKERARRKKEDNARLIRLVEQAMRLDPRLKLFRKQEQDEKDRLKNEK
jgi:DnaJ family protein C protein 2